MILIKRVPMETDHRRRKTCLPRYVGGVLRQYFHGRVTATLVNTHVKKYKHWQGLPEALAYVEETSGSGGGKERDAHRNGNDHFCGQSNNMFHLVIILDHCNSEGRMRVKSMS